MKHNNLLLVIAFLLGVILLNYNAVAVCSVTPPSAGDWNISSDPVVCADMEIILNGNLRIDNILQLSNVTLKMNSTNGSNLFIDNSGELYLLSSSIEKEDNDNYFFWNENPDSLVISNSNISGCGINTTVEKNQGLYIEDVVGLEINGSLFEDNFIGIILKSDDSYLERSIFSDNRIHIISTGDNNNFTKNRIIGSDNELFFTGNNLYISSNILPDSTIDIAGSGIWFINNSINSGGGLYADVGSSTIENNTVTGCDYGLRIGTTTDSDDNIVQNNILNDNKYGIYIDSEATNSQFIDNKINGNPSSDFSVAGIYLIGIENVLDKNIIEDNVYGIFASGSSKCNVTESVLKDNKFGLYSEKTSSLLIKDSVIENNTKVDLNILSTSLILINANYTTMFRNWTVIIQAFDSNGTRVGFTAQVDSNTTTFDIIEDSDNGENVSFIIPEIFEDKDLSNPLKEYNPYIVTVSNTSFSGFKLSTLNITSDEVYTVNFNGTYNETPPSDPPDNFILQVYNPRNQTYIKNGLVNNSLPVEVRSTENLTSCVYILNGGSATTMTKAGLTSYTYYITGTDFSTGSNRIYFRCNGEGGIQNTTSTVYFTVYADRECLNHDNCLDSQFCKDYECSDLECGCGVARNHECSPYECCNDDICALTEECSNHQCKAVTCECPEKISNHKCVIPSGYCCKSTMCKGATEICDMNLNRCIERTLKVSLSTKDITIGEELEITVKDMQGVAVEGVEITANFPSGNKLTAKTDISGTAKIEPQEAGEVNIVARKSGYAAASSTLIVREGFNLLIVLLIVIIGVGIAGAFLFLRSRGGLKRQQPLTLKKIIQGNNVSLSVKNDTKEPMREVIINDQIPHGAFITSNMRPAITQFDANTDNLSWRFLSLDIGQEITVNYQTYKTMEGFAVKVGDQEYLSD